MPEPSVVAIMLTKYRPAMARQAVEAFRRQTYQNKRLMVLDTSYAEGGNAVFGESTMFERGPVETFAQWSGANVPKTIGQLRNVANDLAYKDSEIFVHWDDDDISHPNRIAEQVHLLQSSRADVVGYSEALFWREPRLGTEQNPCFESGLVYEPRRFPGEAWLYTSRNPAYAIGSSLAYRREVWERRPFEATSQGEEVRFLAGLKVVCSHAAQPYHIDCPICDTVTGGKHGPELAISNPLLAPRMVCRIHPGNTSSAYDPKKMSRAKEWQRVPQWDEYCRGVFA